ncbi:MAG: thioredoxin [Eubacteriales bacterium]
MAEIIENVAEFDALVSSENKVLVDFFATWCGPCRMFAPTFDEFAREHADIPCVKVDVDQNGEIAKRYGIMSIPTIILFEGGEAVKKNVGTLDAEELEEFAL